MTDARSLLACPFCGSSKVRIDAPTCDRGKTYDPLDRVFPTVGCGECFAMASGKNWDQTCETAVTAWNRRAALAAPVQPLAQEPAESKRARVAGFVADNWPHQKYWLAEIEQKLLALPVEIFGVPAAAPQPAPQAPEGWVAQPVAHDWAHQGTEELQREIYDYLKVLVAIDGALGLPEDGCNSPARTLEAIRHLKSVRIAPEGPTTDQCIEVAGLLEQKRALNIVADVRALQAGFAGEHPELPTPFQAGMDLACEEITHRIEHDESVRSLLDRIIATPPVQADIKDAALSEQVALVAPEGFVMVPREPTLAMIEAAVETPGFKAIDNVLLLQSLRNGGRPIAELGNTPETSPLAQAYRAMLAAAPTPEGWKLLPVEPAQAMLEAAYEVYIAPTNGASINDMCVKMYDAMIAAAPALPTPLTQPQAKP